VPGPLPKPSRSGPVALRHVLPTRLPHCSRRPGPGDRGAQSVESSSRSYPPALSYPPARELSYPLRREEERVPRVPAVLRDEREPPSQPG
jgi:hypothetical protein